MYMSKHPITNRISPMKWVGLLPTLSSIGVKKRAPTNSPAKLAAPIRPVSMSVAHVTSKSSTQL